MESDSLTTEEFLEKLTAENILEDETFLRVFDIENQLEKTKFITALRGKSKKFGLTKDFNDLLRGWQAEYTERTKQVGSNIIVFTDAPLAALRCGDWSANDQGIWKRENQNNSSSSVTACTHPIEPIERLYNIDTQTEKIKLAFFRDRKWQNVTVETGICADKSQIVRGHANRGEAVNSKSAPNLVEYISDVISKNEQQIPHYSSVSRLGWVFNGFAPYDDKIKYDGDNDFRGLYDSITELGDYEQWKLYVSNLRKNSIYLRLQMAASFASPLIDKVSALPFVFHLWGDTGTGKTVGLMVAMSIWGNPALGGLVRTMNMTANNMSSTASFLYSVPFAGDELQLLKSNWDNNYDKIIMFCCEGIDRGRNVSRNAVERLKTWKNSFLFTGEEPVTKSASGGGVKNRVIEAEIKTFVVQNGNDVVNFITDNYGFSGKHFIDFIKKTNLRPQYSEIFGQILKETDTTEKQAMAMACMLLADELATKCIFTGEVPLTIEQIKPFLASTSEVDSATRAYDWSVNWVARNQNRFLQPENISSHSENNGEVWGKIEDNIATINKDVFAEQLRKAGFDYSMVSKFAERGQVVKNSQNKLVHQTKVYGIKASYIKLKMKLNSDEDDMEELNDLEEVLPQNFR